jgi:hypothetical protein
MVISNAIFLPFDPFVVDRGEHWLDFRGDAMVHHAVLFRVAQATWSGCDAARFCGRAG